MLNSVKAILPVLFKSAVALGLIITFAACKNQSVSMPATNQFPGKPTIKVFEMNPLGENTILVFDDTRECLIIDPGCYSPDEQNKLCSYIDENQLKPVAVLNTHCHFDHIFGVEFLCRKYSIPWWINEDETYLLKNAVNYTEVFGFKLNEPPQPSRFIAPDEEISWGNSSLKAIHVPGHTRGSLCFYSKEAGFLISGDVLFEGSIGRTDLPGGDYDTLIRNIHQKLLVLPDSVRVYPGHGDFTSIGSEKANNPFLTD
jgi:hydroxyacylglutathione hydrolase